LRLFSGPVDERDAQRLARSARVQTISGTCVYGSSGQVRDREGHVALIENPPLHYTGEAFTIQIVGHGAKGFDAALERAHSLPENYLLYAFRVGKIVHHVGLVFLGKYKEDTRKFYVVIGIKKVLILLKDLLQKLKENSLQRSFLNTHIGLLLDNLLEEQYIVLYKLLKKYTLCHTL
jgi:hypothetical protein